MCETKSTDAISVVELGTLERCIKDGQVLGPDHLGHPQAPLVGNSFFVVVRRLPAVQEPEAGRPYQAAVLPRLHVY